MSGLAPSNRTAFTLVEMLVTVSLFVLIMSALLSSLYVGTNAWQKVDRKLMRAGDARAAVLYFRRDLERLYISPEKDFVPFLYEIDEKKRETVEFWTLNDFFHLNALPCIYQVRWSVREQEGEKTWTRSQRSFIAGLPVDEPLETVILESVSQAEFLFLSRGKWVEEWRDARTIPEGVQVRIQLQGAPINRALCTMSLSQGFDPERK